MIFFDSHTHLYLPEYEDGGAEAVKRAINAGVSRMLFPNVDCGTVDPMKSLHNMFPENTFMAMGLHPTEVGADWKHDISSIVKEFDSNEYVAVGEIGIDLYWDSSFEKEQLDAFDMQVNIAVERDLPIIIHCREGLDKVIEVLEGYKGKVRGVFHSFGGSIEDVDKIRRTGDYYFGINGIATFKNSKLRTVLPSIGLNRILLETDSPYLAPVPNRGKRNESSYLVYTANVVAESLGSSVSQIAEATTFNADNLFLNKHSFFK